MVTEGYPPLLTSGELARVKEHSTLVQEYFELIDEYNEKRFRSPGLATQLANLVTALTRGGVHGGEGGEEYDSGAVANEGIATFVEFWETYPKEQQQKAYRDYPGLEEWLGRLMRPSSAEYRDVYYCVEIIAGRLEPIVEECRRNETDIVILKEKVGIQEKLVTEAMKKVDYPVLMDATAHQLKVLRQIFQLSKEEQKEVFKHTPTQSALHYALEYEPLALPQYFDLLDDDEDTNEILVSARFGENEDTALICAAKAGGKESVALLLEAGAEIDAPDINGSTALHWAAQNGHNLVVEGLIKAGAQINAKGAGGNTALTFAVEEGRADVVATLLEHGADLTARNNHPIFNSFSRWWGRERPGHNALDLALEHHPELIEPLLLAAITLDPEEQKSYLAKIEDGIYPNVFMYAAVRHSLLFDGLIAKLKNQSPEVIGAILNSRNNEGKTLLMLAAGLGRVQAVEDLLKLGANITDYSNNENSVLHEAATNAHAKVVELILGMASESEKTELMTHQNVDGNTPLHVAVPNGGKVVTVFLEHGADINARNLAGDNAIDIAIKKKNPQVIDPLLFKANTLPLEEQKSCLINIEYGAYENVLLYAMCEQPSAVNELLLANDKMEQCLAGDKAMARFFDVDAHIATFQEKLKEMERKAGRNDRYDPAVVATKTLIRELKIAKAEFILAEDMSLEEKKAAFKHRCLDAAQQARPVLETHRQLAKYVASLILVLLTLPISAPLLAMGIFSLKTQSAQKLDWLEDELEDKTHPVL